MQVTIHVGLHKTGSTHIQVSLARNKDTLLSKGVLYPNTGRSGSGHHNLPRAFTRDRKIIGLWDDLSREIAEVSPSHVVLSSEEFEGMRHANMWRHVKDKIGDARIICYLRPQDEYLESSFNQHIKNGYLLTFPEHRARFVQRLSYNSFLESLDAVFGTQAITIRIFQRHELRGDLSSDFFHTAGINTTSLRFTSQRSNEGLSDSALRVATKLGSMLETKQERRKMCEILAKELPSSASNEKPVLLSVAEREAVKDLYADENRKIARKYLGRDYLFSDPNSGS